MLISLYAILAVCRKSVSKGQYWCGTHQKGEIHWLKDLGSSYLRPSYVTVSYRCNLATKLPASKKKIQVFAWRKLPEENICKQNKRYFFKVFLTVFPNMIVFFTNLMHRFLILIHLLDSFTCFEHYCAHLQEDNCISTTSGMVTLETFNCFQSDETRCCTNTIVLLKMSIIVLETCREM